MKHILLEMCFRWKSLTLCLDSWGSEIKNCFSHTLQSPNIHKFKILFLIRLEVKQRWKKSFCYINFSTHSSIKLRLTYDTIKINNNEMMYADWILIYFVSWSDRRDFEWSVLLITFHILYLKSFKKYRASLIEINIMGEVNG